MRKIIQKINPGSSTLILQKFQEEREWVEENKEILEDYFTTLKTSLQTKMGYKKKNKS